MQMGDVWKSSGRPSKANLLEERSIDTQLILTTFDTLTLDCEALSLILTLLTPTGKCQRKAEGARGMHVT